VLGTVAPPAVGQADVKAVRVAGADRFETAASLASAAFPTGNPFVVLANGRTFSDALAGAPFTGAKGAPLLLTEAATTPPATRTALANLKATTIYLLGGTSSISRAQEDELASTYTVHRIAGSDRYATAAAIADEIGFNRVASLNGQRTAFVATGLTFADALTAGPLAIHGASSSFHPILLVDGSVPAATSGAIARLGIKQVVILGGTTAVSKAVADKLAALTGNPVVRYAGTDRFDTAVRILDAGVHFYGMGLSEMLLLNGQTFSDALAAGILASEHAAPLLLTKPAMLPEPTTAVLRAHASTIAQVTAVGGPSAVSAAVLAQAKQAAEYGQKPPPRPAGGQLSINVETVDLATKTLYGCLLFTDPADPYEETSNATGCTNYTWDAGDTFQLGDHPVASTMAEFETFVSLGDDITGTYAPGGQSTFRLVDEAPLPPTGLSATALRPAGAHGSSKGAAQVTWTASKSSTANAYTVRRTDVGGVDPSTPCPSENKEGAYVVLTTPPSTRTTSFTDDQIPSYGAWCYVVNSMMLGRGSGGPSKPTKVVIGTA